jgi:hypothetical protein
MGIPEAILAELDGVIVPSGFERRKTIYRRRRDGNIAVLNLSAPGWDPEFIGIDGNLGVLSGRISRVLGPRMSFSAPAPGEHHWYRWAGELNMPDQPVSGWAVHKRNGAWDLTEVIRQLSRAVLPALEAHSSDEGLRDDWRLNRDTWRSEAEQLAFLIVLLRDLGPSDEIPGLQQRLRYLMANGDRAALKLADSGLSGWIPK